MGNSYYIISAIIADKCVLKDYLTTAASIGTIRSESSRVYSAGICNTAEFTRDRPKNEANNEKMKEN